MSKSKKLRLLKKDNTPGTNLSAVEVNDELLYIALEAISIPVLVIDANSNILFANTTTQELFRVDKEAIELQPVQSLFPGWESIPDKERVAVTGKCSDDTTFHAEIDIKPLPLDEQTLFVLTIHPQQQQQPKETTTLAISRSSEIDRLSDESKSTAQFFKELFEEAPLAYHALDENGNIIDVNYAWLDLTGYERGEVIGRWFGEFLKPKYQEQYRNSLSYFKEVGFKSSGQYELVHKSGANIIISIDGKIGYDEHGNFRLCHCILQNVTEQKQAELALRESEEKYRAVLEKSADNIFLMDVQTGRILEANHSLQKLLGYSQEELTQLTGYDFIAHPKEEVDKNISRIVSQKKVYLGERQYRRKDGSLVDVEVTVSVIDVQNRKVMSVVSRDITERKQAERILRESEEKFRNLSQEISDGVAITIDGKNHWVNKAFCTIFGYSEKELIGKGPEFLITPEELPKLREQMKHRLSGKAAPERYETKAVRKDGKTIIIEVHAKTIQFGEQTAIQLVVRDITEQKEAEQKLQQQNTFLSTIIEALSHPFYVINVDDFSIVMANSAAKLMMMSGKATCYALIHGKDKPCDGKEYPCPVLEVTRTGKPVQVEHVHIDSQGNARTYSVHGYPIVDKHGDIKQVIEYAIDITDQKRTEAALQQSEQEYRGLFEHAHDAIIIFDPDTEIVLDANQRACELYGFEHSQFIGMSLEQITKDIPRGKKYIQTTLSNRTFHSFETTNYRSDGTEMNIEINASVVDYKGKQAILSINRDITERKIAERKLRESEERFRQLSEAAEEGIVIHNKGIVIDTNKAFARMFGYSTDELIGKSLEPLATPESWQVIQQKIADNDENPYEVTGVTKSGKHLHCLVVGKPYSYQGETLRVAAIRDITILKHTQHALQQKADFENLITHISTQFINLKPHELDTQIEQSLQAIGKFVNVDRSYVFLFDYNSQTMSNTHEWCADDITPEKDNLQHIPVSSLPYFWRFISNKQVFHVPDVSKLPPEAHLEREEFEREHIKSLICVPMVTADTILGFLGFDSVKTHKHWSDDSITLLKIVGEIFVNTLQRIRTEQALHESEARLASIFRAAPIGIGLIIDKKIKWVNDSLCSMLGYSVEELINQDARFPYLNEKEHIRIENIKYQKGSLLGTKTFETRWKRKNGETIDVLLNFSAINPQDISAGITFTAMDITDRKRAEEAIRESEERFRKVFEDSHIGMAIIDKEHRFIRANTSLCTMLGYTEDELKNLTFLDITHEDDVQSGREQAQKIFDGEVPFYHAEKRYVKKNGEILWGSLTVSVMRDEKGNVLYTLPMVVDITERKIAEEALSSTMEELRAEREALAEKNIALKQILEHIEAERKDYKQKLCRDVEEAISSVITQLRLVVDEKHEHELEALDITLHGILGKDFQEFTERMTKLTPRELEICDMIKQGKTSKQIAGSLNLSLLTVHKHREQIRKKLGIINKSINLSTYLKSHSQ